MLNNNPNIHLHNNGINKLIPPKFGFRSSDRGLSAWAPSMSKLISAQPKGLRVGLKLKTPSSRSRIMCSRSCKQLLTAAHALASTSWCKNENNTPGFETTPNKVGNNMNITPQVDVMGATSCTHHTYLWCNIHIIANSGSHVGVQDYWEQRVALIILGTNMCSRM